MQIEKVEAGGIYVYRGQTAVVEEIFKRRIKARIYSSECPNGRVKLVSPKSLDNQLDFFPEAIKAACAPPAK